MQRNSVDISVIVVSHNTCALLTDCLRSIYGSDGMASLEVYVVDNASSDDSVEMVSREFPAAQVMRNGHNAGFAAANNQALRLARGNLLVLLNSDATLLPDALSQLGAALAVRPELALAGLQLVNPDGSLQPSCGRFPSAADELLFQSMLYRVIPTKFPYGRRVLPWQRSAYTSFRWVDWVTAAACVLRREVYEAIGGLPEQAVMYGEDLEYCWRAKQAGFKIGYCPEARAVHRLQGSAGGDFARWIESYTRGMLAFYTNHCTPAERQAAAAYIRAGSLARIGLWRILGQLYPKRAQEARSRATGYARAAALAAAALSGRTQDSVAAA
jgi:GT2 family glycosyltransferase